MRSAQRLLMVQSLSNLALWIEVFLIFSVPSVTWQASPAQIAWLAAMMALPGLLLGPLIGAALDHAEPLRWMRLGILMRCAAGIALASAPGIEVFSAFILVNGMARTLYAPSAALVTNRLLPEGTRLAYFADLSALDHLGKLVAPLLAGAAMLLLAPIAVYLLPALLALLCWLGLRPLAAGPPTYRSAPQGTGGPSSLPHPLRITAALGIGLSFALALYDPHLPAYLRSAGFDAAMFSWVVCATAIGSVAAALLVRRTRRGIGPARLVRCGLALFCLAVVAIACSLSLAPAAQCKPLLLGLWLLNGFGYELFLIGASVTLQNLCPAARLGRVAASLRSLQLGAMLLAPACGAWLITHHGREAPFWLAAGITLLLLAMLLTRRGATNS